MTVARTALRVTDAMPPSIDRVDEYISLLPMIWPFDAEVSEKNGAPFLAILRSKFVLVTAFRRTDAMPIPEYQSLLRKSGADIRKLVVDNAPAGERKALAGVLEAYEDAALPALIGDLVRRCRGQMAGDVPVEPDPVAPEHVSLARDGGVHVELEPAECPHTYRVTMIAPDRRGLLSKAAGVLALNLLSVHSAAVNSARSAHGICAINTFVVSPHFGEPPAAEAGSPA